MTLYRQIILREWHIKRQGMVQWLYPLVLFLLIITLFPLAIGAEPNTLLSLAHSAIWIAVLLSLVIGVDELFRPEHDNGTLIQLIVAKAPLPFWVAVRLMIHWAFSAGFVAVLSLLAMPLFNLPLAECLILCLSIVVGSPLLLMLSSIASALTLTLKNGAVLVPLIALPMQLPVLIFATGATELYSTGLNPYPTLALLGAGSILSVLVSPFLIAHILKSA